MKLSIKSWESCGLRCPDVKVELTSHQLNFGGVSLIQMPNGTGKTTTLNLIRACLTGAAKNWGKRQIVEYKKKNTEIDKGSFTLDLKYGKKSLTIKLELDFINGQTKYQTTSPADGGVNFDWEPPDEIRRFLNEKFVNLFVFDGEFAEDLLNRSKTEADSAIEVLCQLDLIQNVVEKSRDYWKEQTSSGTYATAPKLTYYQRISAFCSNHLKELEETKELALETIYKLTDEQEQLVTEIHNFDKENRELLDSKELAIEKRNKALEKRNESRDSLFRALRNPIYIHSKICFALTALKDNLDLAKLPSNTSRQFFEELAEMDKCVCGRNIGTVERSAIQKRADNYLSIDATGVINSIKQDIVGSANADFTSFLELKSEFVERQRNFKIAQNNYDRADKELRESSLDERNSKATRLTSIEQKLKELREVIDKIDASESLLSLPSEILNGSKFDDILHSQLKNIRSIDKAKKLRDLAEDEVAQITGKLNIRRQIKLIEKLCEEIKEKSKSSIKNEIVKNCNEELERILSHSPVRLENIPGWLKLEGQEGASVGQVLSVGYAFLTLILKRSNHTFPLVVDSPANPLDGDVRAEIGTMIPVLCDQFIAFTISTERARFVDTLIQATCGEIDFITIFRITNRHATLLEFGPETNSTKTNDGCVVYDKDYFMNFQILEENKV